MILESNTLSYDGPVDEVLDDTLPSWPETRGDLEEDHPDCQLRKSYSLQHSKRPNFSLKHKLRKHLSQKGAARMDLGKFNETFSDGKSECDPMIETPDSVVVTSQTRHRSLDIRALEASREEYDDPSGRGGQKGAKLSLPDNFSSHFPVISLLSGSLRMKDHDRDPSGHLTTKKEGPFNLETLTEQNLDNRYLQAEREVTVGRSRPQSCCIYRAEPEPLIRGIRVNSLFEKFHWDGIRSKRSDACKSLLDHDLQPLESKSSSRNSDSPISETGLGLSNGMTMRDPTRQGLKQRRTSSVETGLSRDSDHEVTRAGVRLTTQPGKLRSKSLRANMRSSFRKTPNRCDKRWSYIEMTEFSSSGAGTPDCTESMRLTLGTPSTGGGGPTFGSERSYASSTMTILKSFEELQDTEPDMVGCGPDIQIVGPGVDAPCFTLDRKMDGQMIQTNNNNRGNENAGVSSDNDTPDLAVGVTEVLASGNDQVIPKGEQQM